MADERRIAYFSMEVGLEAAMPTYSGGLGILAGDTIRSAADLRVPMVAVTLLHRKGYFRQSLDPDGTQHEAPVDWVMQDFLQELQPRVSVPIEGRTVFLRAWQYTVTGITGFTVPVYFLDTNLADNTPADRLLTDVLYGGDTRYRLCQEVVLGRGGVRMLRAMGHGTVQRFHLNEGHAAFLALELLEEQLKHTGHAALEAADLRAVRERCVFTTHTPVPAGHDQFPVEPVTEVVGEHPLFGRPELWLHDGKFNMTYLALNLSRYVNGVAKRHKEVSQLLFTHHTIDSITNGVHAGWWTTEPFQQLYDRHLSGWREDNAALRHAFGIPLAEIWTAHQQTKQALLRRVAETGGESLAAETFTLGFARRAAAYKRADLLFHDLERLRAIAAQVGPIQAIYAGKAHPHDAEGKALIRRIFDAKRQLGSAIVVAYVPNYDMALGRLLTAGVDVWLNTPEPPLEASGTSGMKAALNGVPSFSVLDGWWIEGWVEGVTGWAIDGAARDTASAGDRAHGAARLYDKLEQVILPIFYRDRTRFLEIMQQCIALNGSFFNTQRMMQQYVLKAYFT